MRIALSLLALAFAPALALAGSALDGTWKLRIGSMKATGRPDSRMVVDGTYSCSSCVPALENVPTDGAFHTVSGHAYYDEIRVRVLGPSVLEVTTQRGGHPVSMTTYTVSADGRTLTGRFTDSTGTMPATGSFIERRVGRAVAGAHPASGQWLLHGLKDMNDAARLFTYAMTVDGFSMRSNGQSYDAKFDGRKYPVIGDPGGTQVVLRRIDDHTVHETDYRQGEVVDEVRLSASGDTLRMTDHNVAHRQTTVMMLDRQP
jgi:hypothetical protein